MKSKRTLIIAAFAAALTLGAFPHRASAAVSNSLWFPAAASSAPTLSTIISIAASLLL
jgi:hypothetical protein